MLKTTITSEPPITGQVLHQPSAIELPPEEKAGWARKSVRGSSLLLAGRGLSVIINFATQVLIVRCLTLSEFGAFAFGLSAIVLLTRLSELGLDRGLSRFLPIYHERGDYRRMFGAMFLGMGTAIGLGVLCALFVITQRGLVGASVVSSELSLNVLLILVVLTPLEALDDILEKVLAALSGARALFFRRHVVAPLLKLAAILVLVALRGDVYVMAWAYVLASACGTMISVAMFVTVLRRLGLTQHFRAEGMQVPVREIVGFSAPLVSSDLAFLFRAALVVFLLEFFQGSAAVGAFRAVFPLARLNLVVFDSFKILFLPVAARLFARGDNDGINELFWRNATWLAVLTFPIFLVTCVLAEPTTTLLFGNRYAHSAPILAILSIGYFFNVIFGFNAFTLRVHGKVRTILAIDMLCALVSLIGLILFIPRFGALGGACVTCGAFILQNVLDQIVLVRGGYIRLVDTRFVRVMSVMMLVTVAMVTWQVVLQPNVIQSAVVAALGAGAVMWFGARHLDIAHTFPELQRFVPLRLRRNDAASRQGI